MELLEQRAHDDFARSFRRVRGHGELLSDIAGEHAVNWSQRATGDAATTMAFVRHADVVLVLVDAERLCGPTARVYDGEVAGLLRRVGSVVRGAPQRPRVSIVFTKIDRVASLVEEGARSTAPFDEAKWEDLLRAGAIRTALRSLKNQEINLAAFSVSAFPSPIAKGQAIGIMQPFHDALLWADRAELVLRRTLPTGLESRPFSVYAATLRDWE